MGDTKDTDNDPRPTRLKLFNELVIKKKVKVGLGLEAFKNGICETLEEILLVSKANLSVAETKRFDQEANEFYSYVPKCLQKAGRNKKRMKNRFKVYFDKVISLETVQVCCNFILVTITMDVEFSIYKSILFSSKEN